MQYPELLFADQGAGPARNSAEKLDLWRIFEILEELPVFGQIVKLC